MFSCVLLAGATAGEETHQGHLPQPHVPGSAAGEPPGRLPRLQPSDASLPRRRRHVAPPLGPSGGLGLLLRPQPIAPTSTTAAFPPPLPPHTTPLFCVLPSKDKDSPKLNHGMAKVVLFAFLLPFSFAPAGRQTPAKPL